MVAYYVKAIHWKEKEESPGLFSKRLPDKLAALALNQSENL